MIPEDWNPPTYADLRTAYFKDHPFYCDDCGVALEFRNPKMDYRFPRNNVRLMISGPYEGCVCPSCLALRIHQWFDVPRDDINNHTSDYTVLRKCECCDHEKITTSIIWDKRASVRFGINWWNGWWVCRDCLMETLLMGQRANDIFGKGYTTNEVGARVKI